MKPWPSATARLSQRIADFKLLIAQALEAAAGDAACPGALVDGRYGEAVLARWAGRGWWLARPVEVPGSRPLAFETDPNPGLALRAWPRHQIAKCLVFYDAEDPAELRAAQEAKLRQLAEACAQTGHELLLEVIPPEERRDAEGAVAAALTALYDGGIAPDWWKLPPAASAQAWREIGEIIQARDPHCRGFLILGLGGAAADLKRSFDAAAGSPLCRGFAVGRSIFQPAAEAWFAGELEDAGAIAAIADRYREILALWQSRTPAAE